MGKAIASAILHVAYPDRYGVWNKRVVASFRKLGVLEKLKLKGTIEDYPLVNKLLLEILKLLKEEGKEIGLWELDAIWGYLSEYSEEEEIETIEEEEREKTKFKERQIQEILINNWNKIKGLENLELLTEEDEVLTEYEIQDVGRVDILAKDKKDGKLVIVELKVNLKPHHFSQLLMYLKAAEDKKLYKNFGLKGVKGLILFNTEDKRSEFVAKILKEYKLPIETKKYNVKIEVE